ncbi:hypothetical protein SADUNF_Sadunf19G0035900 [Salix dunnii]|uniref:Cupin type-1 domain-containing protein n=1 Tax=Salix dunnii TaxID=1413687 RepID=A0A835MHJ6_9ROSI|nr:hypothetical protein SADUNF_Sadunf19G0035900 [Salix dunnii]
MSLKLRDEAFSPSPDNLQISHPTPETKSVQDLMEGLKFVLVFFLLAVASSLTFASDPSPLQDFCVAINETDGVFVNGKFCKDPKLVSEKDFFFPGLNIPRNTSNPVGSTVTPVNVVQIPGLNTLGISLVRIDYAPYGGLNPPHTHPRATEVLFVMEGTLYVGFVTSNPENRLITKVLNPGDVFVFPVGLIHFQFNVGEANAVAFAGLSSQNPGVITIGNAVFGSEPPINPDVLTKAFQLDKRLKFVLVFVLLAVASSLTFASDPSPLQDFCVAINETDGVFVNGKFCKDPKLVSEKDFFFPGLNIPRNTSNPVGSTVTPVNVVQIPGLNTLGISLVRIDYAPYGGLNPPHTHPRATEVLVVMEGTLYVGFVTSNPENRLITKVLNPGDVFVFPVGLIHFQFNVGEANAVAFAGLSSQNPGVITIGNSVFGSEPPINPDVLTKAFQLDKSDLMEGLKFVLVFVLLALASSLTFASDPSPLQDFCVAINETDGVFVNGKFCKDPKLVSEKDFFFPGLNIPRNTSNPVGSTVTPVNVAQIPGLNTLGISLVRIDYAPNGGLNPPHTHPRATEVLFVMEGTLYVGFVTSNPENRLITKVLNPGDVFVFPVGLIHFQFNVGEANAVAFAGLSSQNPGVITIGNAVFGSEPPINPDVLTKAFQLDKSVVSFLQKQFWWDNN